MNKTKLIILIAATVLLIALIGVAVSLGGAEEKPTPTGPITPTEIQTTGGTDVAVVATDAPTEAAKETTGLEEVAVRTEPEEETEAPTEAPEETTAPTKAPSSGGSGGNQGSSSKPAPTDPPATNPPATNPPATEPPATEPEETKAPSSNSGGLGENQTPPAIRG